MLKQLDNLGLPLLPPSLAKNQSFKQGANYAVAGATALNQHRALPMQAGNGVGHPTHNNISLAEELAWFDAMKHSLCSSPQACKDYFAKALGCAPGNLVLLGSQNKANYEPVTGCLKTLHQLSQSHNSHLRKALSGLGARQPGELITYADLYVPVIGFAAAPARYGFDGMDGALRACCGGGGVLSLIFFRLESMTNAVGKSIGLELEILHEQVPKS